MRTGECKKCWELRRPKSSRPKLQEAVWNANFIDIPCRIHMEEKEDGS